MYGPGTAPPQHRPEGRGLVIGLRVLFVVLPVVTLGVCAWGSILRLALALRRPMDWVLLPIVGVLGIGGFILVGVAPDDTGWQSNVGVSGLLVCMLATPAYFLVVDIRGARPARPLPRTAAPVHPPRFPPGPIPGTAPGPIPGAPRIPGTPPYGYGQQPTAPVPPAGPRIHQVRAELDELSDFLRKEEGR
ncbi:hypothetical protein [Streptomyces sp.]|uniref:hypothetical protein n=1 Tax=Streptomyces sp. TaxID=1931 RepID=UPI002F4293BF